MSAAEPSREQLNARARASNAAFLAAMKAVPQEQRRTVSDPEKYADPIGFDDEGRPFEAPSDPR